MKINNQKGEVSKVLLILAGVVLVVIILIFIFARFVGNNNSGPLSGNNGQKPSPTPAPLVYSATVGDIKFTLLSSSNLGQIIKAKNSYSQDLKTTERFIQVIVGAQNQGKVNSDQYSWDLGNIIDSEGRNFVPINDYTYSTATAMTCGSVLKPGFAPVQCTKIYEVAKISKGLKVQVQGGSKKQSALLDLTVK